MPRFINAYRLRILGLLIALVLLAASGRHFGDDFDFEGLLESTRGPESAPGLYQYLRENVNRKNETEANMEYLNWNHQALVHLGDCLESRTCSRNQAKVILFGNGWIEQAVIRGWRGGEGVWGRSMYETLRHEGYTCLMSGSGPIQGYPQTLQYYRMFPDLVPVIIQNSPGDCYDNVDCVKSELNPTGIPIWKVFDMNYFPEGNCNHPMRDSPAMSDWFVNAEINYFWPENPSKVHYLGYSLEDDCAAVPFTPQSERSDRAYMFAKVSQYFYKGNTPWPIDFYERVTRDTGIELVAGYSISNEKYPAVPGVQNLGLLSATGFQSELGKSKALIGVGDPLLSPSPYVGLCQGLPFINPIFKYRGDKNDCRGWETQHDSLRCLEPPYVYNVHAGDFEGFKAAVTAAIKTPIERFIPPWMTQRAVTKRMVELVETDWYSRAQEKLEYRLKHGGLVWTM